MGRHIATAELSTLVKIQAGEISTVSIAMVAYARVAGHVFFAQTYVYANIRNLSPSDYVNFRKETRGDVFAGCSR